MPHRVVYKIAGPMIALGGVLLALGVFAAWNVQSQHQASADLIAREVHGLLAAEDLHLQMREIRYQTNLFLRSRDPQHLQAVHDLHARADKLLQETVELPGAERNEHFVREMQAGYHDFFVDFSAIADPLLAAARGTDGTLRRKVEVDPNTQEELARLSDQVLTNEVLQPLIEFLRLNEEVVERTNQAAHETAETLKMGFLLLGICGAAAGLLMGTAVARTIGRSIVQLNVSVRSVAGKLMTVTGPVTVSHTGGMQGLQTDLRQLEQDITQVVERLQQSEVELLRSEQLARVGQLAAGLAHELRNPLMPIKMLVQSAIEKGESGGLRGRSLLVLNDEIARMEESIQLFLDFARPPVLEQTVVDARELIDDTLELVSGRAAQQRVRVHAQIPPAPVTVRVDRSQIRQLLLNLLLNALDALEQGGDLEVELQSPARKLDVAEINRPRPAVAHAADVFGIHDALRSETRIPDPPTESQFAIIVRDSGPGIPPEILETIFDPFVTTKETGTGLGLSICHRIAMAHQGKLSVANRAEGGAEFTILLPYGEVTETPRVSGDMQQSTRSDASSLAG